jgi:hypothetical protein
MIHESEGLPLILETSDDLPCIHPEFDNFEGDLPAERRRLLSQVNNAAPPFAEFMAKLVRTDLVWSIICQDCGGGFVGKSQCAVQGAQRTGTFIR